MSDSEVRPPAASRVDNNQSHQFSQASQSNTDHDVSRLDMPPLAAERQTSDIHHPDTASVVGSGDAGTGDRTSGQAGQAGQNGDAKDEVLANFWVAVRRLPRYVRLAAALAADTHVPARTKAFLAVGGAYVVSPFDFIPGIIPVAGQLDDLYVLLTALQQAIRATPDDVATAHLDRLGILRSDLDDDKAAVRALVALAARTTLRVGGRLAKQAGQQLMAMASRSVERGRRAGDNGPL